MKDQTSKQKDSKVIILLLLLIIIGLMCYIAYDKIISESKKENKQITEREKTQIPKDTEEEIIISNQNIIDDLSYKVSVLNKSINNLYIGESRIIYEVEQLNDAQKLRFALMDTYTHKNVRLTSEEKEATKYKGVSTGKINVKDVDNAYQKLFGTKISSYKDIESGTPEFEYNEKKQIYYVYGQFPDSYYTPLMYINKMTENSKEAYVYVNVGTYFSDGSSNLAIIYDDITTKTVIEQSKQTNYKIDETNYKKFSEYKYTFVKDVNGNYYYSKIEKVNK